MVFGGYRQYKASMFRLKKIPKNQQYNIITDDVRHYSD